MKITALKYGESVFGENYIFKGGDENKLLPISFTVYLIQDHGRNILVDVGCDDGAGFVMSVFRRPVELLADLGLAPGDITDIIITHAHRDHMSAINHYENAEVIIERAEAQFRDRYFKRDFKLHIFDGEYRLNGEITVKKIAGHSVGSCIVLAGDYVLCGDECYYLKCLTDRIPTGATVNGEISSAFVREYGGGKYVPLLFHDPGILPGEVGCVVIV